MLKLLLLSMLLATFLLPASAARAKNPRRAFESMLVTVVLFEISYAFFLFVIYPRFA